MPSKLCRPSAFLINWTILSNTRVMTKNDRQLSTGAQPGNKDAPRMTWEPLSLIARARRGSAQLKTMLACSGSRQGARMGRREGALGHARPRRRLTWRSETWHPHQMQGHTFALPDLDKRHPEEAPAVCIGELQLPDALVAIGRAKAHAGDLGL